MPSGRSRIILVAGAIAAAVLLAVIAVLLFVVDTGGDEQDETARAWAQEVCGDVQSWYDEVTSLDDFFDATSSADTNGFGAAIDARVADIETATRTLVDELEAAGLPDTATGQDAERIVRDLAASLERRVERVRSASDDARDGGILDGFEVIATVAREFDAGRAETELAVDELSELDPAGELQRAIEQAPACTQLRRTFSGAG
ncbi:MAG: hypothetical protein FJW88_02510 [Actinobacteria bacterium]|nr:hypothetical protein [Actinomycetota bacterium]